MITRNLNQERVIYSVFPKIPIQGPLGYMVVQFHKAHADLVGKLPITLQHPKERVNSCSTIPLFQDKTHYVPPLSQVQQSSRPSSTLQSR